MRRRSIHVILPALAALAAPAGASAHARLLRTQPANGAVVARPPRAVVVVFDDTVRVGAGNAAVANATRASVEQGPPTARGRVLTIPLRARLGHGDYSVRWSIVADDGHRERGVIAFAVGAGGAKPSAVLTASVPLGWWDVAFRLLFYLGLLVAAGATVFAIVTRRYAPALRQHLSHLLFFALLVAFVGCSGVVHDAPGGTRNALVLEIALALSAAGAAAAALAPRANQLFAAAGACSLLLLATPSLSGHALDHDQPWLLSVPADIAHVGAAAVWLGALVTLLFVVPRSALPVDARGDVVRRVSSTALAAVIVLAASGGLRALTELRGFDQLWTTTYGRALLVKTALLTPLLALGWLNRTHLLGAFASLRRSVRMEVVLLTAVVGVVAVLVQLRPGKAAPPAAAAPIVAAPQPPKLPPRDAVVDARELGPLAVAVARSDDVAIVTLLGQDGTGQNGRDVRIDGRRATACGAGCYRAQATAGALAVSVGGRPLRFTVSPDAPAASALLARVTRAYRSARSIVFAESLRSSPRNGELTLFQVQAPNRLAYRIRGGAQAVVIGGRRWDRAGSTGRWLETPQTPLDVTQPYWQTTTNAHLVAPGVLTFFDPQLPAWFRVDDSGRFPTVTRMTAAAHFMVDRYAGFDVPAVVSPPR